MQVGTPHLAIAMQVSVGAGQPRTDVTVVNPEVHGKVFHDLKMVIVKGRLSKTAAGFNTYDVYEAEADLVFPVVSAIQNEFCYEVPKLPGFSLTGPVVELVRGDVKLVVSWDNWSGLFVMALDEKGDPEVRKIEKFLDGKLDELSGASKAR